MAASKQAALERFQREGEALLAASRNPDPLTAGLSIVVPAYNAIGTVEPLLRQLASMPEVQRGEYEVILTDDASSDGTVAKLCEAFPRFSYIESPVNGGFGANANRGIAAAAKGYTALVNTDIELVGNPFPELLASLGRQQEQAAVMPLVYNTALQKVENLQTLRFSRGLCWNADLPEESSPSRTISGNLAAARPPLAGVAPGEQAVESLLCGACFVAPTVALQAVQGFSQLFRPFYWEDVDLGWRLVRVGPQRRTVNVISAALVLHRHSESIDKAHGAHKFRFLRLNQLRFVLRHLYPSRDFRHARWWWLLRGLRECVGGDPVLRDAYFKAARGVREV